LLWDAYNQGMRIDLMTNMVFGLGAINRNVEEFSKVALNEMAAASDTIKDINCLQAEDIADIIHFMVTGFNS